MEYVGRYTYIVYFCVQSVAIIKLRLKVEQASNKTKNTSYSARQGVSQGQKPYTQTTFFSLRKFPFPRSMVSRTVWLRSAVSPRYARSDNRSALSDNLSYFPTISESETFSRKKKLVCVSVLPLGYTLSSSRNYYSHTVAITNNDLLGQKLEIWGPGKLKR